MNISHLRPALVLTLFFVVVTGLAFPGAVWALGNILFPHQARGSLIYDAHGKVIGSELLGQTFVKPGYFHSRPSAAGSAYDGANSGGTNLGPTSRKLVAGIQDDAQTPEVDESYAGFGDLARAYRLENELAPDVLIPSDAATRSASGLDPHISPANAELQASRVAKARGLDVRRVVALVQANTSSRFVGLIGEPRVNVLKLNLALDELK